jgi:very-short-patch-repair endonuclease
VGRVDFLVEGWLIIECDSKAHHEGWDKQRRDRRRDLAAAA